MSKFGELIKEENPTMTEADFSGPWPMPASHQASVGNGIVRRAEGSLSDKRSICWEKATDAVYLGDLKGFLSRHWRQYGRKRACQ